MGRSVQAERGFEEEQSKVENWSQPTTGLEQGKGEASFPELVEATGRGQSREAGRALTHSVAAAWRVSETALLLHPQGQKS